MKKVYFGSSPCNDSTKRKKVKDATPKQEEGGYLVVVQGSQYPPIIFHDTYNEALNEATRLATKENKRAYVVKVMAMVELTPNVTKY
jgi:hypothetical protein